MAILPFLAAGRVRDLLTLPRVVATVMPVVTANGHNLWWIAAALQQYPDDSRAQLAARLGISEAALYRKLRRYGLGE